MSLIQSDQPEKWQQSLADLITDPKELLDFLQLDSQLIKLGCVASAQFPLRVPRLFAERMEKGNRHDPLLRQVWPDLAEQTLDPARSQDPLQEARFNPIPGLLHKYQGRVLLTATPNCAIHCRYCFRRHFDYKSNTPGREHWREALDYVAQDSSINEVILSGGDPLVASDSYLKWLLSALDAIPHISSLRIHTRLPIVIPERISHELRQFFNTLNSQLIIVVHCNHANELDNQVKSTLRMLARDGHLLLNQSVLLREVNDDLASLVALSRALFASRVLPYYLHLPDAVVGTGHFDVSEAEGMHLIEELQDSLPGYLVPTLVREEPGTPGKTRLA